MSVNGGGVIRRCYQRPHSWLVDTLRCFCTAPRLCSGHSRWSKIRHDKGKEDSLKSRARSILSEQVYLASKHGGPNPDLNSRLATAIANAKRGALSKTSIESAIAKGQGKSLSGAPLENVTIEAMLPNSVGAIIECVTEKRAHLLQEIRKLLRDNGGVLTASSYLFEKKGRIVFEKTDAVAVEDILERAIEVGALDVDVSPDGNLFVDTEPFEVYAVAKKLAKTTNLNIETASAIYHPKVETALRLKEDEATELERVIALLEDEPSVQDVYVNVM